MRRRTGVALSIFGFLLIASAGMFTAHSAKMMAGATNAGPTTESALEAERALSQAMRSNDGDAFCRLVDADWAIVDGNGGLGEGAGEREDICAAMKAGIFTRKTYEVDLEHARVRVYGNVATITFHLSASGALKKENWSCKEVQTDVLRWEDGRWKGVLTHETIVKGTLVIQ